MRTYDRSLITGIAVLARKIVIVSARICLNANRKALMACDFNCCITTTQPSCLHNLFTVQPPRSTRCSSLVTLARQSTSSFLRITDLSFLYASRIFSVFFPSSLHGINSRLLSINHALISPTLTHLVLWVPLPPSLPSTHHSHPLITHHPSLFYSRLN